MKFDDIIYGYYKADKLSNNQTIGMYFIRNYGNRDINYHVALAISAKRKYIKKWLFGEVDYIENESTGKCGIEGLIWSKQVLFEFENFLINKHSQGNSRKLIF